MASNQSNVLYKEKLFEVDCIISVWFRQCFTEQISLKNLVMIITKYVVIYKNVPFDKAFIHSRLTLINDFEVIKHKINMGNTYGSIARLKYPLLNNSQNIVHFHLKLKVPYWQIGILSNESKLPNNSIDPTNVVDDVCVFPYAHLLDDEKRIAAPKLGNGWIDLSTDMQTAKFYTYAEEEWRHKEGIKITMICDFTDIQNKFLKFSVYDRFNGKDIPLKTVIPVKNYNYNYNDNIDHKFWYPFVTIYSDDKSCRISFKK